MNDDLIQFDLQITQAAATDLSITTNTVINLNMTQAIAAIIKIDQIVSVEMKL